MRRGAVALCGLLTLPLWGQTTGGQTPGSQSAAATPAPTRDGRVDTSTKAVVAALGRYVADYQQKFSYLLADEMTLQTSRVGTRVLEHRTLRGEIFATYMPSEREWIAVHDTIEVDGGPVERGDLQS